MPLFTRLRSTGVVMLGVGNTKRALCDWLKDKGVPTFECLTWWGAVGASAEHRSAPILVIDDGVLDVTQRIVQHLDHVRGAERPIVVAVSGDLGEGLAELGWKRSTHRVGFARAENVLVDVENILDDLLRSEPVPPPPEAALDVRDAASDGIAEIEDAMLQDLASLLGPIEWAAPTAHRMKTSLVAPCALGELPDLHGTITFSYSTRFTVSLTAALPTRSAFFAGHRGRKLLDFLKQMRDVKLGSDAVDDAFVVNADDAGLAEARAVLSLLERDASVWESVEWNDGAVVLRSTELFAEPAVAAANAGLELWRAIARHRLGL